MAKIGYATPFRQFDHGNNSHCVLRKPILFVNLEKLCRKGSFSAVPTACADLLLPTKAC